MAIDADDVRVAAGGQQVIDLSDAQMRAARCSSSA
jgi:hypothetical protein